ncbi:MAG TPA: histidine phosphatase family protein [Acidimicrobiales bacterium]|nr:histidine phosphatase family protein [Acidimicrobiales bacterium]
MNGPDVWLVRHGQTEWSVTGQHTGRTDLPLTEVGVQEAQAVAQVLSGLDFSLVLSSPRQRARVTAEIAGFEPEVDEDLAEWDYGDLEGLTTAQICDRFPGWTIWQGPWPGGEDAQAVTLRCDRVIDKMRRAPEGQRALVFAHGHILRALAARWVGCPVSHGRLFGLSTATVSVLGWEHAGPAVRHWNVPPPPRTLDGN